MSLSPFHARFITVPGVSCMKILSPEWKTTRRYNPQHFQEHAPTLRTENPFGNASANAHTEGIHVIHEPSVKIAPDRGSMSGDFAFALLADTSVPVSQNERILLFTDEMRIFKHS